MFKVNEYFYGKVKSLACRTAEGPATIGVMAPGEYEFGTSTVEVMTVVSGTLTVKLPGSGTWKDYKAGESFRSRQGRSSSSRSPPTPPTSASTASRSR